MNKIFQPKKKETPLLLTVFIDILVSRLHFVKWPYVSAFLSSILVQIEGYERVASSFMDEVWDV